MSAGTRPLVGGWWGMCTLLVLSATLLLPPASAARDEPAEDLTDLSLEQLMNLEVTTVSRKREARSATAAAVYVITQEDIRRSGVTSLPEALRLAPGVQVARIDANKWAIGIRGFASRLSRSVLVMIDGRSVYTPLFAGTYWEVQDTLLDDVERIEIVRGPGGAVWGANAVNGVINIITKSASDTQGVLLKAGGGNEEQGFGAARYGGAVGKNLHYRVYGKFFNRDGGFNPGGPQYDGWRMGQQGFRLDWDASARDAVKVQGDVYDGRAGQSTSVTFYRPPFIRTIVDDAVLSGGNLLGRWRRTFDKDSELILWGYYDNTLREEPSFRERRNTGDLELQHRIRVPWRQEVIWGLGYRVTSDATTRVVPTVVFDPQARTDHLGSVFVQDEIRLLESLRLILGSKFEHNDYTGFELQPSGRLVWTPDASQAVWGSVSRAVRTPSRVEDDLLATFRTPGAFGRVIGDGAFVSEKVVAYELGYRIQPLNELFLDVAGFYNRYDDLLSAEPGTPFTETRAGSSHLVIPFFLRNGLHGATYGGELGADAMLTPWWRLHVSYSYLDLALRHDAGSRDTTTGPSTARSSPHNQATAFARFDLPWQADLDTVVRYVDNLPAQQVGSYVTFDVRLAKRIGRRLEVSAVGQNLAEAHHREFAGGTAVERGAYGMVRWRW